MRHSPTVESGAAGAASVGRDVAATGGAEVDLHDIYKTYDEHGQGRTVLAGINHTIPAGAFVAVVGKSGCGKSTLLSMIGGLVAPTSGSIRIDGATVTSPKPDVGIVFQRDSVFPWRTVKDNLTFGLEMRGEGSRAERTRRALELLSMVGLEEHANAFPKELSGGMRQRVAIAQTLICEPRVLLMDEPFGALDALTRESLQDFLLGMWARQRMTVFFVTHGVEEAVYLSDFALVMAGKPAGIRAVHQIELPRPRGIETRESAYFTEMCGRIRRDLEEPSEVNR